MSLLRVILPLFRALFRDRSQLDLENLALRRQLAILRHKAPRPRLRRADWAFWVSLARIWEDWRSALILVRPETALRWHRLGFRYFSRRNLLVSPRPATRCVNERVRFCVDFDPDGLFGRDKYISESSASRRP